MKSSTSVTALSSNLFNMLLVLAVGTLLLADEHLRIASAPGPLSSETTLVIEEGESLPVITSKLFLNNVIDSKVHFTLAARIGKAETRLKAGEFRFAPAMGIYDVINLIEKGTNIRYKVTIPEGWISLKVHEKLNSLPHLSGNIEQIPSEGSVLPGTYFYERGETRSAVLDRLQSHGQRELEQTWEQRQEGLPLENQYEMLVLASIVEREALLASELGTIARVFINRLEREMPLQADPTVIYAVTEGKSILNRPISKADLRLDSPYNTYRVRGLPPTPIANPSAAALRAVANPPDGPELYFVADGNGGHHFSTTYNEHRKKVAEYRQREELEKNKENETQE